MADQDLPELQQAGNSRGKQLVFYFMSAVVIAVVIFLLGVSVGKGVRPSDTAPAPPPETGPAGDTTVATVPPPPAATPTDLKYHETLQGTPADASRSMKPESSSPAEPPPPAASTTTKAASQTKPVSPAPAAKPGAVSWQVGAFTSSAAAQRQLAQLRTKKYSASIVPPPQGDPAPRYRVLVGPYATMEEANQMKSRLEKDGFKTLLKR